MSSISPVRDLSRLQVKQLRHELRNPLNAIIGYSELLIEELSGPEVAALKAAVRRVHGAGQSLLSTIDEAFRVDRPLALQTNPWMVHEQLEEDLSSIEAICAKWVVAEQVVAVPELRGALSRIRSANLQLKTLADRIFLTGDLSGVGLLPIQRRDQGDAAPPIHAEQVDTPARVLVVDDHELNRDLLRDLLVRQGHDVDVARDGTEALLALQQDAYDLMMLDIVMPQMDGYEVLRRVKGDPALADVAVLVLSSLDDVEAAVRCVELGAVDHLSKPVESTLLRARVTAALAVKRSRDREQRQLARIERERQRADALLYALLPGQLARELQAGGSVRPRNADGIPVLYADIANFRDVSEDRDPVEVLRLLQELAGSLEACCERHNVLKIRSFGPGFLAAVGLLQERPDAADVAAACAAEMVSVAASSGPGWSLRVGMHSGPVLAGVVGGRVYQLDLWGEAVDVAGEIERSAAPGSVTVSEAFRGQLTKEWKSESAGSISSDEGQTVSLFRILAG